MRYQASPSLFSLALAIPSGSLFACLADESRAFFFWCTLALPEHRSAATRVQLNYLSPGSSVRFSLQTVTGKISTPRPTDAFRRVVSTRRHGNPAQKPRESFRVIRARVRILIVSPEMVSGLRRDLIVLLPLLFRVIYFCFIRTMEMQTVSRRRIYGRDLMWLLLFFVNVED